MKRLVYFIAATLLLTACGSKKTEGNTEEVIRPTYNPTELTAKKDPAFAKYKNLEIPDEGTEKNNKK
jgi:hypothetical protein